jgi:hypothetical protein
MEVIEPNLAWMAVDYRPPNQAISRTLNSAVPTAIVASGIILSRIGYLGGTIQLRLWPVR